MHLNKSNKPILFKCFQKAHNSQLLDLEEDEGDCKNGEKDKYIAKQVNLERVLLTYDKYCICIQ